MILVIRAGLAGPACAQAAPNDRAWELFNKGLGYLESKHPLTDVADAWKQGLKLDSKSETAKRVAGYIGLLEKQEPEDEKLRRTNVDKPDLLPESERIQYCLERLVLVHGFQMGEPGTCFTVGLGNHFRLGKPSIDSATRYTDTLVVIGRPAIPGLIRHLTDTRLTRSLGHRNSMWHVLRAQDAALECIECITHCRFFFAKSTVDYLSMGPEQRTRQIIQDVTSWWDRNKDRPPVDGYIDRLNELARTKEWLGYRLQMIEEIEEINPKAIDTVGLLKSWAHERPDDESWLATTALELSNRGDKTLLPEMRQMFRTAKDYVPKECLWLVLRYGNADDWKLVRSRALADIRAARGDEQKLHIAWQVLDLSEGHERGRYNNDPSRTRG